MISAEKIENLIPEILMDSDHFYLILLDVEGNVLNSNKIFQELTQSSSESALSLYLSAKSGDDFTQTIDEMLSSPKQKRHLLLDFEGKNQATKVWWEFSVITSPEMDFLGVMGVGIEFQFLKNEFPWENLSDVLGFSKIKLSPDFELLDSLNASVSKIGLATRDSIGKNIFETLLVPADSENQQKIDRFKQDRVSCCLLLKNPENCQQFAGLLVSTNLEFHLFILPKNTKSSMDALVKPFTENQLSNFPGSIWIVDQELRLLQQNNSGSVLSNAWKGKPFKEGSLFSFNHQSNRFTTLLDKVKDCVNSGNPAEVELRVKVSPSEFGFWKMNIRPIKNSKGERIAVLIQAIDISAWGKKLMELQSENQQLKELALKPSHILRSPLSSMLGLLDLIDPRQLDKENQKYFSYLKPLAKELDDVIRTNAKKMSIFD